MAYTVQVHEWTSTGAQTNKTGGALRFKNANNATVDTDSAMTRQTTAGGVDYSFEKYTRLKITGLSTAGSTAAAISNLRFYTDGANGMGTGITVFSKATTGFTAPAHPSSTTGFTGSFTYVSTASLTLSTGTHSALGHVGKFAVHLCRVTTGVTAGISNNETVTYAYDETT